MHFFAIDIIVRDQSGRTALYWATRRYCAGANDILLQQSDIESNVEDLRGCTPLLLEVKIGWKAAMNRKSIAAI